MSPDRQRVLLAIRRVGGRAQTNQVAGQLGTGRQETLAVLDALAADGELIHDGSEWRLVVPA